jgi:hypothetical protein
MDPILYAITTMLCLVLTYATRNEDSGTVWCIRAITILLTAGMYFKYFIYS